MDVTLEMAGGSGGRGAMELMELLLLLLLDRISVNSLRLKAGEYLGTSRELLFHGRELSRGLREACGTSHASTLLCAGLRTAFLPAPDKLKATLLA